MTEGRPAEPAEAIERARVAAAEVAAASPGERAAKALLEAHLEESGRLASLIRLLRIQRSWSACTWHLEIRHQASAEAARQAVEGTPEVQRAGIVDLATGRAWAAESDFPFVAALLGGAVEVRRQGDLDELLRTARPAGGGAGGRS